MTKAWVFGMTRVWVFGMTKVWVFGMTREGFVWTIVLHRLIVTADTAILSINLLESCHSERPLAVRNLLSFGGEMGRERCYYVYIMSSKSRVIYVGMTGFLMARVLRHRAGEGGAFTQKYRVHRLVYFESFQNVENAIARETEIKKWRREKKVELIRRENPTWEDMAAGWGEVVGMKVGKAGSSPVFQTGSE
jgi:putative endonuclease